MDEHQISQKMTCLAFGIQAAKMINDPERAIVYAKEFWEWLNEAEEMSSATDPNAGKPGYVRKPYTNTWVLASPSADDDIPF